LIANKKLILAIANGSRVSDR